MTDSEQQSISEEEFPDTPDGFNQVELNTISGETHYVEYVLRHPNREFVYAHRVTEVDGDGELSYNDVVVNKLAIESINSKVVDIELASERVPDGEGSVDHYTEAPIWIHHHLPMEYVNTEFGVRAWAADEEIEQFVGSSADQSPTHSPKP